MTVNYRCSHRAACGASKTLAMPIDSYVRRPMCPMCGKDTLRSVDVREKARNKARRCDCDGWPFPHAKAGSVWCTHHATGPTDDDCRDRYGK